jgi:putative ABC transport system substrate-binding protein
MRSERTRLAAVLVLWLALLACLPAGRQAAAGPPPPRIVVLLGPGGSPNEEILAGFRRRLDGAGLKPEYAVVRMDEGQDARPFHEALRGGAALVLALGSQAAGTACREAPETPVVAGGILRPDVLPKGARATGVFLEQPADVQMKRIRAVLPGARTVGVLYNPEENRERISAAVSAARELGLRIEARPVSSPLEIPSALDDLSRRADVLWTLYDRLATTPGTARELLLSSFRQRVPLFGLSAAWAKAGALCAPDWDYDDIGAQCADSAVRILNGEKPSAIAPAPPRRAVYVLNLNSARKIGVRIPGQAVRDARRTFPGPE